VVIAGVGRQDRRLTVLALIHDEDAGPGVFSGFDEVASLALGRAPARDAYDAVMIFGGEANVDEDHEWLRREKAWIAELLERGTPLLGVCLGAQLIADVAGAQVRRLPEPEVGWHHVSGSSDFLPDRFLAFEWHRYGFEHAPPGAVELARNDVGCQAFRLGNAYGIQFHAEVDQPTVEGWIRDYGPEVGADAEALAAETEREIGRWNDFGRELGARFLSRSRQPAHRGADPR
jgi:GMP synthase (glutamine-hydrolysing)